MGNLNCLTNDYNKQKKSQWYDDWHNNSSYPYPFDYYDPEYFNKQLNVQRNLEQQNPNYLNYMYNNPLYNSNMNEYVSPEYLTQMPPDSYPCETLSSDLKAESTNSANKTGKKQDGRIFQDEVETAFMSDWLAKEEAALRSNVRNLECLEIESQSDSNSSGFEEKPLKANNNNKVDDNSKVNNINNKVNNNNKVINNNKLNSYKRFKKTQRNNGKDIDVNKSDSDSNSDMKNFVNTSKPGCDTKNEIVMGFGTKKNGNCCYTAYISCRNSIDWDNFLKKTARFMTGLQRQFQCTVKFSDTISFHRGNSVRTFQIIGPQKGNVIRCKAALPKVVTEMLITPMTGSAEIEQYSKECNFSRTNTARRGIASSSLMNNINNIVKYQ